MAKTISSAAVFTALLLSAGCGARHEYRAERLFVSQSSWDSVRIDVSFARRTAIGGAAPVQPDTVVISIFDASYETVYAGTPGRIALPDHRLGDRERLTVEACGTVKSRQICIQEMLRASPKRLTMEEEILYPAGSDLAEGRYEFTFQVERQAYDGRTWEQVEAEGVDGYVLAWVDAGEAGRKGVVRFPFTAPQGRFDLSRQENYKNFRYYLDSELLDEERAEVKFEVYAGLSSHPQRLTTVSKEVLQKTEDERADDVRYFVEQATERLIDELSSFLGGRRAMAYVEEWDYNRSSRTYRVTMEADWEGSFFNRRDFEIDGELAVNEDGSNAVFRITSGNRRALRRWRERSDGDEMHLGTLEVFREGRSAASF